jgi:hypothetical protein
MGGVVLTGLAVWLGRHAQIEYTIDLSRPPAYAPQAPNGNAPGLRADRTHQDALNQPRNLNGSVVMISSIIGDSSIVGTGIAHALELLRMQPEDATPNKIAELLDIPVEKVTLDQPLFELLVAEIHPEVKAGLIAELGTESATPREIRNAARSLGFEENELFVLSRRVPVTLRVLQQRHADPEVKALLHAAQVYAWNVLSLGAMIPSENHAAQLAPRPIPGLPAYPESNLRFLLPGSLPQSDRQAEGGP